MEYTSEDWRRLGREVHAARLRQGMSDTTKWALTVGRSTRVVLGLERGEPVGRSTVARIENALAWAPGRAWSILAGTTGVVEVARREGPDLSTVTTDALLEELAKRARASNSDADR